MLYFKNKLNNKVYKLNDTFSNGVILVNLNDSNPINIDKESFINNYESVPKIKPISELPDYLKDGGAYFLGFNENWKDEAFNPQGVAQCFMYENITNRVEYCPSGEFTLLQDEEPTHFIEIPFFNKI